MSAKPVRLRLSRAKGFNLQQHSLATNGLPAVKVDRTTRYGNPFTVGGFSAYRNDNPPHDVVYFIPASVDECVTAFRWLVTQRTRSDAVKALAGKNLACWCALDAPCHADVLLELANSDSPAPSNGGEE